MAVLANLRVVSAGLYPEFAAITALEIEDVPLGGGAFGQNFACRLLNHAAPTVPLAIKVLQDNGKGSLQHSRRLLLKLLGRLRALEDERLAQRRPSLRDVCGLMGLPQFMYEGSLHGRNVCGYGALRLDTLGYAPLDTYTEGDIADAADFLSTPPIARIQMAADLAEAFALLDSIGYVHGDINPQNLFVNPGNGRLAVIDFDSGAIVEQPGDHPDTWGKPGDWLAPELVAQLTVGQASVCADRLSDLWSVGIGIHYLLFLHHPLVFLNDFGLNTLRSYFQTNLWPEIVPSSALFHAGNRSVYRQYRQQLTTLPQPIVNAFDVLINQGTFAPDRRPTGEAWLRALNLAQDPPRILFFIADRLRVPRGEQVMLAWAVENADRLVLNHGGDVTGQTNRTVSLNQNTEFRLIASNAAGSVEAHLPPIQAISGPRMPRMPLPRAPIGLQTSIGTPISVPHLLNRFLFPTPQRAPAPMPNKKNRAGGTGMSPKLRLPSITILRLRAQALQPEKTRCFWEASRSIRTCLMRLRCKL